MLEFTTAEMAGLSAIDIYMNAVIIFHWVDAWLKFATGSGQRQGLSVTGPFLNALESKYLDDRHISVHTILTHRLEKTFYRCVIPMDAFVHA